MCIFFLIFCLVQIVNHSCPNSWRALMFCCFSRSQNKKLNTETYSNNVYKELSIEDLKNEYKKTKSEYIDYSHMLDKKLFDPTDPNLIHFMNSLDNKMHYIKHIMKKKLTQDGLEEANNTMDSFKRLFKSEKNQDAHRMISLYSYDIKDNRDYKKIQKIEKRIRKFYKVNS